ncbi:basic leucine zipper 4-like [Momordica charantia]|uniref:Basic leucine zipper 4-like n=1 Tax=Momordica charantia TaxID=3673 RepID=A0A6J1C4V8_MOMCH|nr:basic leucine zipper 4-like [Momordica charantia]
MFLSGEQDVRFCRPVLESGFTPSEIQELWSLFEDPAGSSRAVDDERRRKRMMSNRESARRSRLRKKKHLENLTVQMDRLKVKNQELKRQLNVVMNRYFMVRRQNDRLWSEYVALHARLSDLYRISMQQKIKNNDNSNSCMQILF